MRGLILFAVMLAMSSCASASEIVSVKGGKFLMGSPESENWRSDDELQHEVTVSDFMISPREVTQAEYSRLMGGNPSTFRGDNLPVENVTWLEAVMFCNAKSEAEGLTPVYTVDGAKVTWDLSANGAGTFTRPMTRQQNSTLPTRSQGLEGSTAAEAGIISPRTCGVLTVRRLHKNAGSTTLASGLRGVLLGRGLLRLRPCRRLAGLGKESSSPISRGRLKDDIARWLSVSK